MKTSSSIKQTAANNALLAWTKGQYNGKIFSRTSELLNKEGADQAIAYLVEFVRPEIRNDRRGYLTEMAARNEILRACHHQDCGNHYAPGPCTDLARK